LYQVFDLADLPPTVNPLVLGLPVDFLQAKEVLDIGHFVAVALGEQKILLVDYPQRDALVDDQVAQDLLAFQFATQGVVVVAIDLQTDAFGVPLPLLLDQEVYFVVVDCALSHVFVAQHSQEGLD